MPKSGYLYIANGLSHIREAVLSAISLRKVDENAHITLIANQRLKEYVFDRVLVFEENVKSWRQALSYKVKHIYESSPYKRTFFIDSDTYFYSDCRELFGLLDYFDFCIAMAPSDKHLISIDKTKFSGCPSYNTGVIVYKKNFKNKRLFEEWRKIYKNKLKNKNLGRETDQTSFIKAMMTSNAKGFVLPNVFNARIFFYINLDGEVKIVHGRHRDYGGLRKKINVTPANRCWNPVTQKCIYQKMPTK